MATRTEVVRAKRKTTHHIPPGLCKYILGHFAAFGDDDDDDGQTHTSSKFTRANCVCAVWSTTKRTMNHFTCDIMLTSTETHVCVWYDSNMCGGGLCLKHTATKKRSSVSFMVSMTTEIEREKLGKRSGESPN